MLNDAATILPVFSELMRDIVSFRGLGSGGGGYMCATHIYAAAKRQSVSVSVQQPK